MSEPERVLVEYTDVEGAVALVFCDADKLPPVGDSWAWYEACTTLVHLRRHPDD